MKSFDVEEVSVTSDLQQTFTSPNFRQPQAARPQAGAPPPESETPPPQVETPPPQAAKAPQPEAATTSPPQAATPPPEAGVPSSTAPPSPRKTYPPVPVFQERAGTPVPEALEPAQRTAVDLGNASVASLACVYQSTPECHC